MVSESLKRILIILTLGLLTVSAFFIRLENVRNSKVFSIDEIVYTRMAFQMTRDLFDYNTIPYAMELTARGRELPAYFFKPLYKYPPLFTLMLVPALHWWGPSMLSAAVVPILAGVLLIPLTYFFGAGMFNRMTGLAAAFFVFLDPVSIISSQKVWVESSLALFTFLAVMTYLRAFGSGNGRDFILAGIWCGLAANVKYPGFFIIPLILLYALLYRRDILRRGAFWAGMILPGVMLIPWITWNAAVYGGNFIAEQTGMHTFGVHTAVLLPRLAALAVIAVLLLIFFLRRRHGLDEEERLRIRRFGKTLVWAGVILVAAAEAPSLWKALQVYHLPRSGWHAGLFQHEWPSFYLGQLVEFSLLYLFAFASFFWLRSSLSAEARFMQFMALGYMAIMIVWGNFQSRYILVCVPLLLFLSADFICRLIRHWRSHPAAAVRTARFACLGIFLVYAVSRTMYVNEVLSFSNDLCYF